MPEKKVRDSKEVKDAPKEHPEKRERPPENTIYVGNKNTMNYVLATVLQFSKGSDNVAIKARGRVISKAVDVAKITRARFLQDKCKVKSIEIGTEVISEDNIKRNVSTITIMLEKA